MQKAMRETHVTNSMPKHQNPQWAHQEIQHNPFPILVYAAHIVTASELQLRVLACLLAASGLNPRQA